MIGEGRAPTLVATEDVCGTPTFQGGRAFDAICRTFEEARHRQAVAIHAELFMLHSRLFSSHARRVDSALT